MLWHPDKVLRFKVMVSKYLIKLEVAALYSVPFIVIIE